MTKKLKLELIVDDKGSVKLKQFDKNVDASMAKSKKSVDSLSNSFKKLTPSIRTATTAVAAMAGAYAAFKFAQLARDAGMAAARYETLGVVMEVVGKNAGRSAEEVHYYAEELRKTGISMEVSRDATIKLMQAHIDLTHSTKLGRIAQDAAVIGNLNSSEALQKMVYGIQTAQIEVLKTIGITVNFENAYKKLAKQLDKTAGDLTDAEKTQARLNVVIEKGKDIAGAYEASMGTASKKINSFTRYVQDFKVKMGEAFTPAMAGLVDDLTAAMKDLQAEIVLPANQKALKAMADGVGQLARWMLILGRSIGEVTNYVANAGEWWGKFFYEPVSKAAKELERLETALVGVELRLKPYRKQGKLHLPEAENLIKAREEILKNIKAAERNLEITKKVSAEQKKREQNEIKVTPGGFTPKNSSPSSTGKAGNGDPSWWAELMTPIGKSELERDDELFEQLNSQRELMLEHNTAIADDWKAMHEKRYEDMRAMNVLIGNESEVAAKRQKEIAKEEQNAKLNIYKTAAGSIADTFMSIAQAGGEQSKKAFKMYKAFAMVEAAMNIYQGVTKAFAQGGVLGFITGAAVAAAGAVQIGMIASSQPPSYDSGGVSNAKGVYQTGDIAEAHIPIPSGGKIPVNVNGGGGGSTVQVILNNPVFQDAATQKRALVQIAEVVAKRVAPGAVVESYRNDGAVRSMIRSGA